MTGRPESVLGDALAAREAVAFVHAGGRTDPTIRYCLSRAERRDSTVDRCDPTPEPRDAVVTDAVAFDGTDWLVASSADPSDHPADDLARRLADRVDAGTVLAPARIPHDAALYLENAGFSLASSDAVARARAAKGDAERDAVAAAQRAAVAGIRGGSEALASATVADGRLEVDGEPMTADRLRRTIDRAIVDAGGFPAGDTTVGGTDAAETPLRPGEPIVLAVAPRGPEGYVGALSRTVVVAGEGGPERRAHVALTRAFKSARAMLTAGPESVAAVEGDLEAEVRAFGFGDGDAVETDVAGVGREPRERPREPGHEVGPGSVVRLEASARVDGSWLRLADLVAVEEGEVSPLGELSRSLEPAALLED